MCDGSSCLADAALFGKVIDKLFLRDEANVLFVDKAMQRISVPISLRGFKDAFLVLQNK
jgi:invasion protein IalB